MADYDGQIKRTFKTSGFRCKRVKGNRLAGTWKLREGQQAASSSSSRTSRVTSKTHTRPHRVSGLPGEWLQERCRCGGQPRLTRQCWGSPWLASPFQPTQRKGGRVWFWRGSAHLARRATWRQLPPGPG